MKFSLSDLLEPPTNAVPSVTKRSFRPRTHRRNRGRAAPHNDKRTSFLSLSGTALSRSRRSIRRVTLAGFCALALCVPALAQEEDAPAQAESAATRIEVDEQRGVIRFFVKGHEKARLTESGLQVMDDIEFGGTLTDVGTGPFGAAAPDPQGDADAP